MQNCIQKDTRQFAISGLFLQQLSICRRTSWPSQFYFCPWRKSKDIYSFTMRTNPIVDALMRWPVWPIKLQLSCGFDMAQSERATVAYVIKILLQLFEHSSVTTRASTWDINSFIKLIKRRWFVYSLIMPCNRLRGFTLLNDRSR